MAKEKQEQTFTLSEQEVVEVMRAATQIYGWFTPQLANQNLINLNNNPTTPTRDKLNKALESAPYDATLLAEYSQFAEVFDRLYAKTIEYYANILKFDYSWQPLIYEGMSGYEYLNDADYWDDWNRVAKFMDKFNPKHEFPKVVREILRSGKYFTWFRDTQGNINETGVIDLKDTTGKKCSNYVLQTMPQQWCMITGKWDKGWLYSFNMAYFTQAGTSLQSYAPIFRKYFEQNFNTVDGKPYNPVAPLNSRDSNFALWQDTSPDVGAWCFVADDTNANSPPPIVPLIRSTLTDIEMENLQRNANMLGAKGILYGDIGMLDKQKSGQTQDAFAMNPKTLTKFLSLVRKGIAESVNIAAMPTEGTKFAQFDASKTDDIYGNQLKTTAGNAASASRLIYSSDKVGQAELEAQIQTDCNFMGKLYRQFEDFLDFYINKKTRKYKFHITFSGYNFKFIEEKNKKNLLELADKGFVLDPSMYAGIVGMSPQDFIRSLKAGQKVTTKLFSMIMNPYTSTNEGGRPSLDTDERSESANDNYT